MKLGQQRKFNNKDNLNRMLNMRIIGFSTFTLAFIFGIDRTDLCHYFKRYLIEQPDEVYDIKRIISEVLPKQEDKWIIKGGEKINKGKSYEEYLAYSHRKEREKVYS